MAFHTLIFLVVLAAAGVQAFLESVDPSDKIQLTVSRDLIEVGGDPLKLTCTFVPSDHPEVVTLLSLTLSKRSFGKSEFDELVKESRTGFKDSENFTGVATGQMAENRKSESILSVQFPVPTLEDRGEYRCTALGLDSSDGLVGSENSAVVGPANVDQMVQCIKDKPRGTLAEVKRAMLQCKVHEDNWFQAYRDVVEVEAEEDDSVFYVTSIFDSQSFYIYTVRNLGLEVGEELCAKYSGYFAELNTEEEYLFHDEWLTKLINEPESVKFKYLATGAYYEPSKAGFVFSTHPGAAMYMGHWGPGEPHKTDIDHNWILLKVILPDGGGDLQVQMVDGLNGHMAVAYMCEISVADQPH